MKRGQIKSKFFIVLWTLSVFFGIPLYKKKIASKIIFPYRKFKYEEVSFSPRGSDKKISLRGWYLPAKKSDKCIIMVYGWRSSRMHPESKLLEIARRLVYRGYNVLAFDLRAHGKSGGRKVSLGANEAYDALGAHDFLVSEKKISPSRIGLMGFSYGAVVSILAAGKGNIKAVVSDSGPGDTFGFVKRKMGKFYHPSVFNLMKRLGGKLFRIDMNEVDIKKAIKEISTPIFFIHGTKDHSPYTEVQELLRLKKTNPLDRIWLTDTFHHESFQAFPRKYLKNVTDFFEETLKPV